MVYMKKKNENEKRKKPGDDYAEEWTIKVTTKYKYYTKMFNPLKQHTHIML